MYYVSWYLQKLCRFLSKFLCHIETFFGYVFLKLPCEWRHSNTWSPSTSLPWWGQRVQQCLIFDVFKELHLRLLKKKSVFEVFIVYLLKFLCNICMENVWQNFGCRIFWVPISFKQYQNMSGCGIEFENMSMIFTPFAGT